EARLEIQDISEGGASIRTALFRIPDFFYLQFGGEASELVGCYVVQRSADAIHCRFSREMTSEAVERIIVEQDALAALDFLSGQCGEDAYDDLESLVEGKLVPN